MVIENIREIKITIPDSLSYVFMFISLVFIFFVEVVFIFCRIYIYFQGPTFESAKHAGLAQF